ncbi:MAG TPA: hypothetical protein VGK79_08780 [Gaiellaceae bacterium]
MKKLLPLFLLLLALPSLAAAATPRAATPAPYAGQCGIPATQPVWFEFGQTYLEPVFGQPGIVIGASTGDWPAHMRSLGAGTVYFDLNLRNRVGTPTKPTDPATMPDRAKRLYDFSSQQTGCTNPVVVFNELAGPGLVTPWSDTNAQYRQNVLSLIQSIAALGARPVLLIPAAAYTGGDALAWWQQVSAVAEIVREIYVPATITWKDGPTLGNRMLRERYRDAVSNLTGIGIPPNKVGIMISMATTKGFGGRNGLEPVGAWYQVIKWQALAARQVAAETGIASVWSWGWGRWSVGEQDPDKGHAACVWLWARSASLCDAPKQLGPEFETSLREGQLSLLSAHTQCLIGKRALTTGSIDQVQAVTGDRETAYSAVYERIVESTYTPVPTSAVLAAEQAVIKQSFGGSRSAYVAALRDAHANVAIARGVLGDQLRRARVESTIESGKPSASEIETFYSSYPDLQVRLVQAKPKPSWLGLPKGLALSRVAPDRVFELERGTTSVVRTSEGEFRVKALGDPQELGAVPLGKASPAIAAALRSFARGVAFERWSVGKQRYILNTALCKGDDLPQPSAVDLTQFLPFLRLG